MAAKNIAADIKSTLAANGINAAISCRDGTWSEPAYLEAEFAGEKRIYPFWPDVPAREKHIARELLYDVYRFVGRPELIPGK